jgi:hypothetical protein
MTYQIGGRAGPVKITEEMPGDKQDKFTAKIS